METWRSISEFPEAYEVSDFGRIRSITRCLPNGHKYPGKILSTKVQRNGYLTVHLSYRNKPYTRLVHRLVASTFIENPNGFLQVNHINENKKDNRVENLEWCSGSRNCKYGHRNDAMINQRKKAVNQYTIDGALIKTFPILNAAARETGVNAAHICDVCKGRRSSAGGFKWEYVGSSKQ